MILPKRIYWPCDIIGFRGSCKEGECLMRQYKIIVEKHPDGYVAYPLGLKGVVVGQGDTYEEALSDVKSAIRFHIETFGNDVLEGEPPILEAFVAEAGV
jgi:predicted RNase H-like HicB family nuclease